jgi:hypothetical protein
MPVIMLDRLKTSFFKAAGRKQDQHQFNAASSGSDVTYNLGAPTTSRNTEWAAVCSTCEWGFTSVPLQAVCNVVQLIYELPVRGAGFLFMCIQTFAVGTQPETFKSIISRLLFLQDHHHHQQQQQHGVSHPARSVCVKCVPRIAKSEY